MRELQHVIERAVLLSRGGTLEIDEVLGGAVARERAAASPSAPDPQALPTVVSEVEWRRRERENLRAALQLAQGRIYGPDGAAERLGVKPTTLISRLKALGLREVDNPYSRQSSPTTSKGSSW